MPLCLGVHAHPFQQSRGTPMSSLAGNWVPEKSIMAVPITRPSSSATTASPSVMVAAMVSSDSNRAVGGGSTGRRAANAAWITSINADASAVTARRKSSSRPSGNSVVASTETARDSSWAATGTV